MLVCRGLPVRAGTTDGGDLVWHGSLHSRYILRGCQWSSYCYAEMKTLTFDILMVNTLYYVASRSTNAHTYLHLFDSNFSSVSFHTVDSVFRFFLTSVIGKSSCPEFITVPL